MSRSERAVVTFIDILGFKDLVEHKSDSEITETLALFRKHNTKHPSFPYKTCPSMEENLINIKIIFFSDSVVRIRYASDWEKGPLTDGHYMFMLEKELILLAEIQSDLLQRGILIRGGITIGEIYYNEEANQLFGKAMNRAYELESNIANYPRIVIDPTFSNVYSRSIDFIESPISIDSEMLFSVDYFYEREAKLLLFDLKRWPEKRREILHYIKESTVSQKDLLEKQRKAIIDLLLQSTSKMRIHQKDSPAEHLFRFQDIKVFGKHAWTVNRFNAAVDSWNKVWRETEGNRAFVDKIIIRDFQWTDPHFLMDENSFSYLPGDYEVEDM